MFNRRILLVSLVLGASLCLNAIASARKPINLNTPQSYSEQAFAAAQAAGKPILLDITAPWCPVCKVQHPILATLKASPKFANMVVFNIDFDTSKDLLRTLRVTQQSTLIVYKGKNEVGRSTGDTNPASIEALLEKAL